jgi:hypothetical protein
VANRDVLNNGQFSKSLQQLYQNINEVILYSPKPVDFGDIEHQQTPYTSSSIQCTCCATKAISETELAQNVYFKERPVVSGGVSSMIREEDNDAQQRVIQKWAKNVSRHILPFTKLGVYSITIFRNYWISTDYNSGDYYLPVQKALPGYPQSSHSYLENICPECAALLSVLLYRAFATNIRQIWMMDDSAWNWNSDTNSDILISNRSSPEYYRVQRILRCLCDGDAYVE